MNSIHKIPFVMILKLLGLAILLYGLLLGVSSIYIEKRIGQFKSDTFTRIAKDIQTQSDKTIAASEQSVLSLALAFSNDATLKNALLSNDVSSLHLENFSRYLRENRTIKNVYYHLINTDAKSIYRTHVEEEQGALDVNAEILHEIMKKRSPKTILSVGKLGLSLKVLVPVFDSKRVIGIFAMLAPFDPIVTNLLLSSDDYVILIDKAHRKSLYTFEASQFIQEYYLAHKSRQNQEFLKKQNLEKFLASNQEYYKDKKRNVLTIFYTFKDEQDHALGHILYFKSLSSVDLSNVYQTKRDYFTLVSISYLFLMLIALFLFIKRNSKSMEKYNTVLQTKIQEKTQEINQKSLYLQAIIDGVPDAIMLINRDYSVTMMNKTARDNLDKKWVADDKKPRCYELFHKRLSPCAGSDYPCPLSDVFESKKPEHVVHNYTKSDNEMSHYDFSFTPLLGEDGTVESVIEVAHDISSHMKSQSELHEQKENFRHLAYYDSITGLPNRLFFLDRLEHAIELSKRTEQSLVVIFLDLDQLKTINDTLGYKAGEALLEVTANRLSESAREMDTVARVGSDAFVIILEGYEYGIVDIVRKLLESTSKVIIYQEHQLYASISMGVAMYPKDGDTSDTLLKNADIARFKAKEIGENRYQFYTEDMNTGSLENRMMEDAMRQGLEEDAFILEYQPQFDIRNHSIVGMEALVRWEHPKYGTLPPGNFIALAQQSGLILTLGERVLILAAQQAAIWHKAGFKTGRIAINISAKQLQEENFIFRVASILKTANCQASWIAFEITEASIAQTPDQAILRLREIAKLGISIVMDEFSTGYSSLALLRRLPLDKLKVDHSFIKNIPGDEEAEAIVVTIIELAKNMNLDILAEGIETEQQKQFLEKNSCFHIQGYLYSKALQVSAMTPLLKST